MLLLPESNCIELTAQQMSCVEERNLVLAKELLQVCFDADAGVNYTGLPIHIDDISTQNLARYLVHVPEEDHKTGRIWDFEVDITAKIDAHASSPVHALTATASRREFNPETGSWRQVSSIGSRRLIAPMIKVLETVGLETVLPVDHAIGHRSEVTAHTQPEVVHEAYQPDAPEPEQDDDSGSKVDINAITL